MGRERQAALAPLALSRNPDTPSLEEWLRGEGETSREKAFRGIKSPQMAILRVGNQTNTGPATTVRLRGPAISTRSGDAGSRVKGGSHGKRPRITRNRSPKRNLYQEDTLAERFMEWVRTELIWYAGSFTFHLLLLSSLLLLGNVAGKAIQSEAPVSSRRTKREAGDRSAAVGEVRHRRNAGGPHGVDHGNADDGEAGRRSAGRRIQRRQRGIRA